MRSRRFRDSDAAALVRRFGADAVLGMAYALVRDQRYLDIQQLANAVLAAKPACLSARRLLWHARNPGAAARLKRAFPGRDYVHWLRQLHRFIRPRVYVEIGIDHGRTLALARKATLAIGIDPTPSITESLIAKTIIHKTTSDDFFRSEPGIDLRRRKRVDFAFIDGRHHFDQVVRDFCNLAAAMPPGSVIAIHDTLPIIPETATRVHDTYVWVGDVWKAILVLRALFPSVAMLTLPCSPSGLTLAACPAIRGVDRSLIEAECIRVMDISIPKRRADLYHWMNVVDNQVKSLKGLTGA